MFSEFVCFDSPQHSLWLVWVLFLSSLFHEMCCTDVFVCFHSSTLMLSTCSVLLRHCVVELTHVNVSHLLHTSVLIYCFLGCLWIICITSSCTTMLRGWALLLIQALYHRWGSLLCLWLKVFLSTLFTQCLQHPFPSYICLGLFIISDKLSFCSIGVFHKGLCFQLCCSNWLCFLYLVHCSCLSAITSLSFNLRLVAWQLTS